MLDAHGTGDETLNTNQKVSNRIRYKSFHGDPFPDINAGIIRGFTAVEASLTSRIICVWIAVDMTDNRFYCRFFFSDFFSDFFSFADRRWSWPLMDGARWSRGVIWISFWVNFLHTHTHPNHPSTHPLLPSLISVQWKISTPSVRVNGIGGHLAVYSQCPTQSMDPELDLVGKNVADFFASTIRSMAIRPNYSSGLAPS